MELQLIHKLIMHTRINFNIFYLFQRSGTKYKSLKAENCVDDWFQLDTKSQSIDLQDITKAKIIRFLF